MNHLGWRCLVFSDRDLTPIQERILEDMAEGMTSQEIARAEHRSFYSVQEHIRRLLIKLHAKNRAHAVAIGFRKGLLH